MKHLSFVILLFLVMACTVPREARNLKNSTKDWRQAEIIMMIYNDSPLGSTFMTFRENDKFELVSTGFFMKSFECGTWNRSNDTILLNFIDVNNNILESKRMIIDHSNSTLYFEGKQDEPVYRRLKLRQIEPKN